VVGDPVRNKAPQSLYDAAEVEASQSLHGAAEIKTSRSLYEAAEVKPFLMVTSGVTYFDSLFGPYFGVKFKQDNRNDDHDELDFFNFSRSSLSLKLIRDNKEGDNIPSLSQQFTRLSPRRSRSLASHQSSLFHQYPELPGAPSVTTRIPGRQMRTNSMKGVVPATCKAAPGLHSRISVPATGQPRRATSSPRNCLSFIPQTSTATLFQHVRQTFTVTTINLSLSRHVPQTFTGTWRQHVRNVTGTARVFFGPLKAPCVSNPVKPHCSFVTRNCQAHFCQSQGNKPFQDPTHRCRTTSPWAREANQ
jgi:hypothetical protein